jgi:hypothetical protein
VMIVEFKRIDKFRLIGFSEQKIRVHMFTAGLTVYQYECIN